MSSFTQIIDLPGLNGVEPQKAGADLSNNVDPKNLGVDFSKLLGAKLTGELPFLFGADAEATGQDSVISNEILSDKSVATLLSNLSNESVKADSEGLVGQNDLIDPLKIGLEKLLKINTTEANGDIQKSSNVETALTADQNPKVVNPMVASNRTVISPELKMINPGSNNIDSVATQIANNNAEVETRPNIIAEIDKELVSKNSFDLKAASLIDKVAGSLNIKSVRLEKNSENNRTDKEPVKMALPTKSYIKVTTVDNNSKTDAKNEQAGDSRLNLFSSSSEIVPIESKIGKGEKTGLNNFEAMARVELDQKPVNRTESGQSAIQTKLISDMSPALANNVEKIEMAEIKISETPAKFVLPTEINGKNIRNNHTVMIRMEPDHLGPVRMTLSTHNDILTARLVVESPVAKAVVESNLNNLIEQLDRQGIKVESFSVSVSGGEVDQNTKENRFAGSAERAFRNLKGYKNSNAINEVMAQRAQEHLYIEANGVNCFA